MKWLIAPTLDKQYVLQDTSGIPFFEGMANEEPGFVNGGDNDDASAGDRARARDLALRYRCEFVDLHKFTLQPDVFKKVPVHLMFRYNFVPLKETRDGRMAIAVADPAQLMLIDEISLLLGQRIITQVATLVQITEILNTVDKTTGVDENPTQIADPPDDSLGASDSDAPVRAPLKPKPHRSSGAMAVPEQDDSSASSVSRLSSEIDERCRLWNERNVDDSGKASLLISRTISRHDGSSFRAGMAPRQGNFGGAVESVDGLIRRKASRPPPAGYSD